MTEIYLDHNATTGVRPEVVAEMVACLHGRYGNPSSVHRFGQEAGRLLEKARRQVARFLSAHGDEIVFCGSGTEANNLALIGAVRANTAHGGHVLISSIEHHSVLQPAGWLREQGYQVEYLPCDSHGVLRVDALESGMRPDTILVSCMIANNDTGVVQPIAEIASLVKGRGILFHADGVAAAGKMPLSVRDIPADLLSVSSHKIRGPGGAAALYVRKDTRLESLLHGGNQERKLRPGTENLPGIVGFGRACELDRLHFEQGVAVRRKLQQQLEEGIRRIPQTVIFGEGRERLCNTTYAGFSGVENDLLAIHLDMGGVAVSTGAACHASERKPSHVLSAMGFDPRAARSGIRFSTGEDNTEEEIDRVLGLLPGLVESLRMHFHA